MAGEGTTLKLCRRTIGCNCYITPPAYTHTSTNTHHRWSTTTPQVLNGVPWATVLCLHNTEFDTQAHGIDIPTLFITSSRPPTTPTRTTIQANTRVMCVHVRGARGVTCETRWRMNDTIIPIYVMCVVLQPDVRHTRVSVPILLMYISKRSWHNDSIAMWGDSCALYGS